MAVSAVTWSVQLLEYCKPTGIWNPSWIYWKSSQILLVLLEKVIVMTRCTHPVAGRFNYRLNRIRCLFDLESPSFIKIHLHTHRQTHTDEVVTHYSLSS